MAENPRQDLYLEISMNLEESELTHLRDYVIGAKILPARSVQNANAHQIFNQLEKEKKLKHGDLSLLADILRKIHRQDYAEKAEKVSEDEGKAGNVTQQPDQIQTRKRGAMETSGDRKRPKPDVPPPLPIVVEILAQIKPTVKTPKQLLSYASAKRELVSLDITTEETLDLLKQIKPEIKTMEDLLDTTEAIKQLEEIKGVDVTDVKMGSLVFYLLCTDLDGLGELWFMYRRGELDGLLRGNLIRKETLKQLCAESISVKATINIENFRKILVYHLSKSASKGPATPRLPQEYPFYQPPIHVISIILDVLHLDQTSLTKVCRKEGFQAPAGQGEDGEDDLLRKFGNLQIAGEGDTQNRLETLLAELNTSEVMEDKAQQCYLYLQIGDLYRDKLHNLQAALQYYQHLLECAQELPEEIRRAVAYNRLGLTCDSLGLQEEAFHNHEMAFITIKMLVPSIHTRETICVAYKNLASSLALSGHVLDAKSNYESALDVAMETGNKTEQMDIYCKLGDLHSEQLHEPLVAYKYYTEMSTKARDLGSKKEERIAYSRLAKVYFEAGEYEAALEWSIKLLNMSQEDGDKEGQIAAHLNVGNAYRLLGKLDQATFHFSTGLHMAQKTGDQHAQMKIYFLTGDLHREQLHSPHTAIQYYEQYLDLARQLEDKNEETVAYNRLGVVHHDIREYEVALKWNLKYLKIVQQVGDKEEQIVHTNVGTTYRLLGKLDQATFHYNTALHMAKQRGDQQGQMEVYFNMGELQMEQLHSPHTAIQYYKQALALARQLGERHGGGLAYRRLGLAHYEMREFETALEWSKKHLKMSQEDGDKEQQVTANSNVGDAYRFLGKLNEATSHFNTALQMAQQIADQHKEMDVYFKMGDMHEEQLHSSRTAIQYYEKALDLARQLNDRNQEEFAYNRLGVVHFNIGEHETGLQWFQKALKIQANEDSSKQGTLIHSSGYPKSMHLHARTSMMVQQMKICFQAGETQREQLHSPRTSIKYYGQALAVARQLGDRHEEGMAYDRLGRVHFELKEYEKALDSYQKYLTLKEDDSDKQAQITAHKNIAKSYKKLGKKDLARSHYQSAMKIAMETGDKQQQEDMKKKIAKL